MTETTLALADVVGTSGDLFRSLGMFWSGLYQDPEFVRGLQAAGGFGIAQARLEAAEAENRMMRTRVPLRRRVRWYPVKLRLSQRNATAGNALKFGMTPTPVFGEQSDPAFPAATVFSFGGAVAFRTVYLYPVDRTMDRCVCLVNRISAPTRILVRDTDFTVTGSALALRACDDPFTGTDYDVETGDGDSVTVMWACDAEFDDGDIRRCLGYPLGIGGLSDAYSFRALNAIWDVLNFGPTPKHMLAALAALANVPTAAADGERVLTVSGGFVITDAGAYDITGAETGLTAGDVLSEGQPLCNGVWLKGPLRAEQVETVKPYIPSLTLSPAFFAAGLEHGLSADWTPVPLTYHGSDANGNPRLSFVWGGTAADNARFWEWAWAEAEAENVSLETCFRDSIDATVDTNAGAVWGYVTPLAFFLSNFGSGAMFAGLDTARLSASAVAALPGLLSTLRNALPAHLQLFLTLGRTMPTESYDLNGAADTTEVTAGMSGYTYACAGGPRPGRLTYRSGECQWRWIPG